MNLHVFIMITGIKESKTTTNIFHVIVDLNLRVKNAI